MHSYRGEIMCRFYGIDTTKYKVGDKKQIIYNEYKYDIGDRVAQIVFLELPKITLIEVE